MTRMKTSLHAVGRTSDFYFTPTKSVHGKRPFEPEIAIVDSSCTGTCSLEETAHRGRESNE